MKLVPATRLRRRARSTAHQWTPDSRDDEAEDDLGDEEDDVGARGRRRGRGGRPRRRRGGGQGAPTRGGRGRPRARPRRNVPRARPEEGWADPTHLGRSAEHPEGTIRIQSRVGFRACAIELKPGLWVVAEVADPSGDEFAGAPDVRKIARDALVVVDQALETVFPARRQQRLSQEQQREQQREQRRQQRRLERRLERQQRDLRQQQQEAVRQQAALPMRAVDSRSARWAPRREEEVLDAEWEEVED